MRPVEIAHKMNRVLDRSIPFLTPIGVALGILLPYIFINLRPHVPWLFGSMTLAGALKLRARDIGKAVSTPIPLLVFFFTARIVMPLMILFISRLIFKKEPDIVSGYVLLYSVPIAVTSFVWVSIHKGDLALALTLVLLDTILAPVVVPGTVRILLGASINLDMTGMVVSLSYMIALPTILGVALNETSRGKIPALITPWLNPFSKICMPLVIAANSAAVAPQVRPDNPYIWIIIVTCISFSSLGFVFGKCTGLALKFGREKQISFFFTAGLRNTAAAMTLAIEFFPVSAGLPSVLGVMFQQTVAAVMGRIFFPVKEVEKKKIH